MTVKNRIIFVADAHLKGPHDENQRAFAAFLRGLASNPPEKLVLLGDIFDFWLGSNSVLLRNYGDVVEALSALRKKGVPIIYVEGNHDFILDRFFGGELGASVHAESADIVLDGRRVYLMHGDTVAMTPAYFVWRYLMRSIFIRALERVFPGQLSWRIASLLSKKSRAHGAASGYNGIDERLKVSAAWIIEEGFDAVIAGHSHKAVVDPIKAHSRSGTYANPGGWTPNRTYLVYENGEFRVEKFNG